MIMKLRQSILITFLLIGSVTVYGLPSIEDNQTTKKTNILNIYHPVHDWNVQLGGFLGLTNMFTGGLEMNVCYLIKNKLSVGGGIGYHNLEFKITTTSDEHLLSVGMIPYFSKFDFIFDNSVFTNSSYFLTARYGGMFYHKTKRVIPRQIDRPYWEAGFGILGKSIVKSNAEISEIGYNSTANYRIELALQQYGISGVGESTYNSTIDFNLRHTLLILRFTFCL